jgi:hypothetical protein
MIDEMNDSPNHFICGRPESKFDSLGQLLITLVGPQG